jgi:hypothetical protein
MWAVSCSDRFTLGGGTPLLIEWENEWVRESVWAFPGGKKSLEPRFFGPTLRSLVSVSAELSEQMVVSNDKLTLIFNFVDDNVPPLS